MKRLSMICGVVGVILALLSGISFATVQSSANYTIRAGVLAGSGGGSASTDYSISQTAAQSSPIGGSSSASYRNYAGFWTPAMIIKAIMGDLNRDGIVALSDAIMALQVISNIKLARAVDTTADVNGDGAVGTAEIIYILQRIAELRQN
jgi:hypothetical protein